MKQIQNHYVDRSKEYWDYVWIDEDYQEYKKYINTQYPYPFLEYFKQFNVAKVCDVGCGFGKYSVAAGINGFEVYGMDISEHAIKMTKDIMDSFNLQYRDYKVCKITAICFGESMFDGVIAHAVIDHVTLADAKKSIMELSRVTKPEGLINLSFDGLEPDDLKLPHRTLDDGSRLYTEGDREGLLFRYYTDAEIHDLLKKYAIVYFKTNTKGDRDVIIQNRK